VKRDNEVSPSSYKKVAHRISFYFLPVSTSLFLLGMFFLPSIDEYKQLFYIAVLSPVTFILFCDKKTRSYVRLSPVLLIVLIFLTYSSLTIFWSDSERSVFHFLKRGLYIFSLTMSFTIIHLSSPNRLAQLLSITTAAASCFAAYFLFTEPSLLWGNSTARISGGTLYNPLLSAHVFGFFWVLSVTAILELKLSKQKLIIAIITCIPLTTFIIMTQSRTPLMAMGLVALSYLLIHMNRKAYIFLTTLIIGTCLISFLFPDILSSRGFSYRPYIWQYTLEQVSNNIILGIGIDNTFSIPQPNNSTASHWADPHNIHLAVLLYTGVVGFLLWTAIYWQVLKFTIIKDNTPISRLFFLVCIFGASCALTEGSAFFSRPKEQWYIIWVPIALVVALQIGRSLKRQHPS